MAFVIEKEELEPGLVLFRRGDVEHRMWYCRIKMPKADRYKTVSLKTSDKESARERAFTRTLTSGSASSMTSPSSIIPSVKWRANTC